MLILTRRTLQSVRVGRQVKITVLGVRGNHVRLGILASADVKVLREELWLKSANPHVTNR
jgi:carbon storage regulator